MSSASFLRSVAPVSKVSKAAIEDRLPGERALAGEQCVLTARSSAGAPDPQDDTSLQRNRQVSCWLYLTGL